jgi:N4-gp56 family major capsid protein
MARTVIGLNDAKAVKRWSSALAVDIGKKSYWTKKFMGYGEEPTTPIQMLPHLENDAGEQISYDLSVQLKMQPVEGDEPLENKEEALKFYTDVIYIDQMRGGVNTGGRMTRKRTLHDLRKVARARQSDWWARVFDELFFMYLSGARGVATDWVFQTTYSGFANNSLNAPDTDHIIYANKKAKATLVATDKMDTRNIERCKSRAVVMGGGTQETPQIQPIMVMGEEHYVLLMHPWQEYDLRISTSNTGWLEIQKAAAGAEGRNNPIFKGALGMLNDIVLHMHKNVVRFSDYGAGSDVTAARALFLGAQAATCAFGSAGNGLRYDWHEETRDNGNQVVITTSSIFGVKKCRFNSKDFGVVALDTAASDPTQ